MGTGAPFLVHWSVEALGGQIALDRLAVDAFLAVESYVALRILFRVRHSDPAAPKAQMRNGTRFSSPRRDGGVLLHREETLVAQELLEPRAVHAQVEGVAHAITLPDGPRKTDAGTDSAHADRFRRLLASALRAPTNLRGTFRTTHTFLPLNTPRTGHY
jgi:hypothetical protein